MGAWRGLSVSPGLPALWRIHSAWSWMPRARGLGEDLRLERVELPPRDRAAIEQVLGLRQLADGPVAGARIVAAEESPNIRMSIQIHATQQKKMIIVHKMFRKG